jgi:hypothetical protein
MGRTLSTARTATAVLAASAVAGLALSTQAQTLNCQYITGQVDPLAALHDVTDEFEIPISVIETNRSATRLSKASGTAIMRFNEVGELDGGVFAAEVDAKLKETDDQDFVCMDSVQVRGVGAAAVVGEDADWVLRSNSRLDGRKRSGTLSSCGSVLSVGGPCSVHRVSAGLHITAQGQRNNDSPKYDRFNRNQKDIFEAVEGQPPANGEDLVLVCSCGPNSDP